MIICVTGPTGVGKTLLSEILAEKYDAIVVNADAMQVYKELDIGTAKITKEEMSKQKHLLFDIKNPDENYSVYDYQKDARKTFEKYKDKNIILVGGTGIYIKAALYNYEFEERENLSFDEYSNEELYEMLKKENKHSDVHINNRKRMISKLNSTGNNNLKNELLYKDVKFIGLTTDRETLYSKIDKRVDEMIEKGLLDEVKNVYNKYGKTKALNTGIGYKEIIDHLDGNISLEEAIKLIKTKSRKYAKRQYTWYNNQMNINWFETDYNNFEKTVKQVTDFIEKN